MFVKALVLGLLLVACGGKTGVYKNDYSGPITLTLVNSTPRPIESIFIYPVGHPNRGTSWVQPLPPGATTSVKIREGHFELVAVSQKRRIDAKFSETPEATTSLELRSDFGDRKLVFHDATAVPAGLNARGTIGVMFLISAPDPEPSADEPATEPVVEPAK